ncbi:MAG: hypothetical protein LBJ25_05795 [Candidatus Margulisbacteria bacterium]|jgi:hypothetical protein|nr:hypothetical protein [Candidatus Margulisiibacteriota bacterium]
MWQLKHIAQKHPLQGELFTELFPRTQPPEKSEAQPTQPSLDNLTEEESAVSVKAGYYHNGRFIRNPYAD